MLRAYFAVVLSPKHEDVWPDVGSSVTVRRCGNGADACRIGWHAHPEYELVYVRNGAGVAQVEHACVPYRDGLLLLLGPHVPHADFGNGDLADHLEVVVQLPRRFVEEQLATFPEFGAVGRLLRGVGSGLGFGARTRRRLDARFAALPDLDPAARLLEALAILGALAAAPASELRPLSPEGVPRDPLRPGDAQRLATVYALVRARYRTPLSTADAAAAVGLSTNAFCRFFRQRTGGPFLAYLNAYRVEHAKRLLSAGEPRIGTVLGACGFRDAAYFSRVFRRTVGVSPTEYAGGAKRG